TTFKLVFIGTSAYIIYLMLNDYKPTHDPNLDTFRVQYLVAGSAVLGILFPYKYQPAEMLWAFSIWLEAVAILPQLFMLQRTGEAETITTHYLFALGAYRALYIPNWIYRWFTEGHFEPISVIAGLVQTVLYSDFFYIYYTKVFQGKKFNLPVYITYGHSQLKTGHPVRSAIHKQLNGRLVLRWVTTWESLLLY
ncbi:putative ER lumen protein retaining receptor, partial [Aureobasidium melanogenum]